MVDGADSRLDPDVQRRRDCELGVQDDKKGTAYGGGEDRFQPVALAGCAGLGVEFAAGEGGGDADDAAFGLDRS